MHLHSNSIIKLTVKIALGYSKSSKSINLMIKGQFIPEILLDILRPVTLHNYHNAMASMKIS